MGSSGKFWPLPVSTRFEMTLPRQKALPSNFKSSNSHLSLGIWEILSAIFLQIWLSSETISVSICFSWFLR
jgi:hypothetical protein